ncbi:glycosyltransferase [Rhizobium daejeonense]
MNTDQASLSLSICVVTYKPDWVELQITLESLRTALNHCEQIRARVLIIDNSPADEISDWLKEVMPHFAVKVISGHGNIGFGRANNLALEDCGDYHLVLNPDVDMAQDALKSALDFMDRNPDCGLLSPAGYSADGSRQYLCKRYPSLFDLALRGFAPTSVKALFKGRLDAYEMRAELGPDVFWDPPIVSGCFMLFRGDIFRALHGFDPGFMLYFEDFDISIRASKITRIAYVPDVRILHGGGNAAKKGYWHIQQFMRSAAYFYTRHGVVLF